MWKNNVCQAWNEQEFRNVEGHTQNGEVFTHWNGRSPELQVGAEITVSAQVQLGRLTPDDVSVQIFHGVVDSAGRIEHPQITDMRFVEGSLNENKEAKFSGSIPCHASGKHGFSLRILPRHKDLVEPYEQGMVLWEGTN